MLEFEVCSFIYLSVVIIKTLCVYIVKNQSIDN